MKELLGTACNPFLVPTPQGHLMPMVEVVFLVSEVVYGFDATGSSTKARDVTTVRFQGCPAALRDAAKSLIEYADKTEELSTLAYNAPTETAP